VQSLSTAADRYFFILMNLNTQTVRVLHVVDSLEIGGLERLVHDMVLARGSACTSVACLEQIGSFGEMLQRHGVRVHKIGMQGGYAATAWRLWRYLRVVQADVLHCHNIFATLHGTLAARLAGGIPVVMTKHGAGALGRGAGTGLKRFLVRQAQVAAVSQEAADVMRPWVSSGHRPVRTIFNGLSLAPYEKLPSREEARRRLGLPSGSFVAGIVARVSGQKGHLALVEAFARVLLQKPDAFLLVVGEGRALPDVKDRVRALEVEEQVLFLGARSDVPEILAAMNVFCLPSETEGMPMTVLEAMAAGLPVIATGVGAVPEMVEPGKTGILLRTNSPAELTSALCSLAGDSGRAHAMGAAGRRRLVERFSLDQTLAAYEELYDRDRGARQ